jgi:hypothetical protein
VCRKRKSKSEDVEYVKYELTDTKPTQSSILYKPSEDQSDTNGQYAEIGPSVKQPPPPPPAKPSGTPPVIEEFPSTSTVVIGREVTFKVSVKGDPSPTCTWYHNGVMVENDYAHEIDNGGSLYIPSVEEAHKGTYGFVAVNSKGKVEQEVVLTVTLDDESNDIVGNPEQLNGMTTGSLHINEFGIHVAKGHANNNTAFKALYNVLESGEKEHPVTIAVTPSNKPLNRFANITVYDDNRILLQPITGRPDCQNDYINASYIDVIIIIIILSLSLSLFHFSSLLFILFLITRAIQRNTHILLLKVH